MTGAKPTPDEAAEAERITAAALEAVRKACEGYLGQRQDRESVRAWLRKSLSNSLPLPVADQFFNLTAFQREMAAEGGVALLEPFICGMPEDYDPRYTLGSYMSDVALRMLEWRFRDVLDEMPFTLIRYERARRDGKIHDWQFKRVDETHARVAVTPLEPAQFITVSFGKFDLEGVADGE